ncbi:MAG: PLP-dependent aminotransferase family protein, partial [Micrococcales bacterium]|nr:PLP-dependent aminotransferase family protein [Micrococcales bacterium]
MVGLIGLGFEGQSCHSGHVSPSPTISAARTARLVGDVSGVRPAYRALADALRLAIADGRVPVGARLPSERDLTRPLGVSRTTVTRAYDVLRESGYLVSRQGSGSVASLPSGARRRGTGGLYPADVAEGVIDLTCAATRAPAGVVEAYERAVERLPAYLCGAGYLTYGVPELREAVAQRYRDRGLPTSADDVLVTSGAVAGLGVVARALLRPGDRVVVEDPSYPNTLDALRAAGARLHGLPVDPTGWDLEEAVRLVGATGARAAALIPDFHNPTGVLLDDDGRARMAHA